MMRNLSVTFWYLSLLALCTQQVQAQKSEQDALMIKKIHDYSLAKGKAYDWLRDLCVKVGPRLAGSPGGLAGVEYTKFVLDTMLTQGGQLQPCQVPVWQRGDNDVVTVFGSGRWHARKIRALTLGGSGSTLTNGVEGTIVLFKSLDEVDKLPDGSLKGKIAFFNRAMDPTSLSAFSAYGGAVDQRVYGPSKASRKGAVGTLVRSMAIGIDTVPHTGVTVFEEGVNPIPAFGISTVDAEWLEQSLEQTSLSAHLTSNCRKYPDRQSYSVIGEIRGSKYPDEIILVGGHLDSWDVGQGAHDDGSGCAQSLDVLNIFRQLGYQPQRTIRCVLFQNEENGLAGGKAYAAASAQRKEKHIAAIESDAGGFSPRGFSFEAEEKVFLSYFGQVQKWAPLMEPYGITFSKGGSGADISPLKSQGPLLIGLRPDSNRYFDYHHTAEDTIDKVNRRELQLGAAAMASLVYLLDQYGLK